MRSKKFLTIFSNNNDVNPDFHDCLSGNEMNFHYVSMKDLAEDILPNPVGNNVIAQIEVGYNGLFSGNSTIFHSMLVVKAYKTVITQDEHKDAIELPD